jgi:hypothetical protein
MTGQEILVQAKKIYQEMAERVEYATKTAFIARDGTNVTFAMQYARTFGFALELAYREAGVANINYHADRALWKDNRRAREQKWSAFRPPAFHEGGFKVVMEHFGQELTSGDSFETPDFSDTRFKGSTRFGMQWQVAKWEVRFFQTVFDMLDKLDMARVIGKNVGKGWRLHTTPGVMRCKFTYQSILTDGKLLKTHLSTNPYMWAYNQGLVFCEPEFLRGSRKLFRQVFPRAKFSLKQLANKADLTIEEYKKLSHEEQKEFIKQLSQERLEAMKAFDKEAGIVDIYTHLQEHYPKRRFNKKTGKYDGDIIMRKHRTKTGFTEVPLTRYCPPDRNEKAKAEAAAKHAEAERLAKEVARAEREARRLQAEVDRASGKTKKRQTEAEAAASQNRFAVPGFGDSSDESGSDSDEDASSSPLAALPSTPPSSPVADDEEDLDEVDDVTPAPRAGAGVPSEDEGADADSEEEDEDGIPEDWETAADAEFPALSDAKPSSVARPPSVWKSDVLEALRQKEESDSKEDDE